MMTQQDRCRICGKGDGKLTKLSGGYYHKSCLTKLFTPELIQRIKLLSDRILSLKRGEDFTTTTILKTALRRYEEWLEGKPIDVSNPDGSTPTTKQIEQEVARLEQALARAEPNKPKRGSAYEK